MLPRQLRVRKTQIPEIMKKGKGFFCPTLSLKLAPTTLPNKPSLFTVVVGSKVEPTAVGRNKLKRRIRHILYKNRSKVRNGFQGVVLVAKPARVALFGELEQDILYVLTKSGLITK